MNRTIIRGVTVLFFVACVTPDPIELTVLSRRELQGVSSASGIEMLTGAIYVIGDNSPWLFKLDGNYEIVDKVRMAPGYELVDGLIAKENKPDFEAIAAVTWQNDEMLFVFGSGSKSPQRDLLVSINCSGTTQSYSLEKFYEKMKNVTGLSRDELNIEGAVAQAGELYLFNRGANLVMRYKIKDFMAHLEGKRTSPEPTVYRFNLPSTNGIEAGFSGAAIIPGEDKIVFTASVENTSNWIDDGEILGSFVGIIDTKQLGKNPNPACVPLTNSGKLLSIKIESVLAFRRSAGNAIHLFLVTDSDGRGASEIIEASFRFFQ